MTSPSLPPLDRRTLVVAGVSIAISAYIALVLAYQKSGIQDPFSVPIFRHLILYQDFYALLPFIGILALALLPPVRALGVSAAALCGRHVWIVALGVTAALAAGTHVVYHAHPLSMDEYALVFQSTIFSEGHLAGQHPAALLDWLVPHTQFRFIRMSAETGATVSGYWPGMSLLLTPLTALGVPWLLNPLIGGATVLVMHKLALALFDDIESAGHVVLLTIASPAVTINALSYYSMPAHLLANAIFTLLLLKPTPGRALLAGLVGSVALTLHNPPPHLLYALPWVVWLAWRSDRLKVLGALIAGYLPLCLLLGWGWAYFLDGMSSPSAVASLATPAGAAGMVTGRVQGLLGWSLGEQLYSLCKIWLWAVPGLVLVAAVGAWQLRKEKNHWLPIIGSALLTYFAYFLVRFDQGHGWGSRYFHSAWLVLPLLAIGALQLDRARPALRGYLAGSAVLSLAILTTLYSLQVEHFMARHLAQIPTATGGSARVVIINRGYYSWDLAQNDPFMRNAVMRLYSRTPQRDLEMMRKNFPQYQLLSSDRRGSVWGIAPP